MIAMLTGTLDAATDEAAIVDVGGVGYLVFVSARTLARLPEPGQPVRLLVETHVREDHIHLYGFLEPAEREWFRRLLTVQGVGARMALAVLGVLAPAQLAEAIAAGDRALLTRADGVGPKLATRIVSELREQAVQAAALPAADMVETGPAGDAVSALVNLGYPRAAAFGAVAHAARRLGPEASVEALITTGLKELAT